MVKKEVYLKFGNRNKAISFESKAGTSDWNIIRQIVLQVSEKDEDLRNYLQNCSNIIFQKYKVKKTSGEKILVDVDENEELEIEDDAELAMVFSYFHRVFVDSESPQITKDITSFLPAEDSVIFELTDPLDSHKIIKEIDTNIVIIPHTNKENNEGNRSISCEMSMEKMSKNVSKRKLESKMYSEKVNYSLFLYMIFFLYLVQKNIEKYLI